MDTLVTINMLKPYYIKADEHHIRIILAHRYFSVLIKEEVYNFVPFEEKEIIIERKTKRILNIEGKYAFQKEEEIIYFTMAELISLDDFLMQLYLLIESYYVKDQKHNHKRVKKENDHVINELERLNVMRLIDEALDRRDKTLFELLVKQLQ